MRALNGFTMSSGILAAAAFAALSSSAAPITAAVSGSASYSSSTSTITNVRSGGPSSGSSRITAEGSSSGYYANYGVMDFNASSLGVASGVNITSISGLGLNLTDKDEYFAAAGPVNFYLNENTNALSSAAYASGAAYGGAAPAGSLYSSTNPTGKLFLLGTETYTPGLATSGGTSSAGYQFHYNFSSIPAALSTYLANQINNFGDIRILATPGSSTTAADYQGSQGDPSGTPPLFAPQLTVTGTTAVAPASDAVLSLSNSNITFSRIVNSSPATSTLTLTNTSASGQDAAIYGVIGQSGNVNANNPQGNGVGTAGTDPLGPGANTAITVGIDASSIEAGSVNSVTGPATATIEIVNHSNATQAPLTVTVSADQVVANRYINNAGGSAGVNFGNILIPNSPASVNQVTQNVQLTTTNSASSVADYTPNSLTTVELTGSTAIAAPTGSQAAPGLLHSAPYGDNSYITMAADPNNANTIFGSTTNAGDPGTETATRSVTYYVPGTDTVGGSYVNAQYYIGYASFGLTQLDSAIGATQNPTGRVYAIGNIYQQAQLQDAQSTANNSVSGSIPTTFYAQLQNAPHTANYAPGNDIGLRDAAVITTAPTGIDAANTQYASAWTLDSALAANTNIGDGQSVNAADFTPGPTLQPTLLNGQYQVQINGVTAENDATGLDGNAVAGATANDLGTHNYIVTAGVTGNLGHAGTANSAAILAGESYNGYNIQRANETGSQQTHVQFLGGTASAATTLSVDFANAPTSNTSVVSDVANITGTGGDTHVVQMSYNPSSISNGGNSPTLAWYNGSIYQAANFGNSGGTATEYTGAYNPATAGENALGSYGINTANDTVWAVVNNGSGNFSVMQRTPGDANGDGTVNFTDFGILRTNFGTTTGATWSQGAFTGNGAVNFTDFGLLRANFGSSETVSAPTGTVAAASMARTSMAAPSFSSASSSSTLLPASDVQLVVNTVTGDVQLVTAVSSGLPIDGYEIDSAGGSLVPGNLHSITSVDSNFFLFDAKTTQISEGSFQTYTLNPSFNLGNIFNVNGPRDLTFMWGDTNSNTYGPTGTVVDYTAVPEPGSLALFALGGLVVMGGLAIRRRIKM